MSVLRDYPMSRPTLAGPTRAAAVKGGRMAGAKRLSSGRAGARRHAWLGRACVFGLSCRCWLFSLRQTVLL